MGSGERRGRRARRARAARARHHHHHRQHHHHHRSGGGHPIFTLFTNRRGLNHHTGTTVTRSHNVGNTSTAVTWGSMRQSPKFRTFTCLSSISLFIFVIGLVMFISSGEMPFTIIGPVLMGLSGFVLLSSIMVICVNRQRGGWNQPGQTIEIGYTAQTPSQVQPGVYPQPQYSGMGPTVVNAYGLSQDQTANQQGVFNPPQGSYPTQVYPQTGYASYPPPTGGAGYPPPTGGAGDPPPGGYGFLGYPAGPDTSQPGPEPGAPPGYASIYQYSQPPPDPANNSGATAGETPQAPPPSYGDVVKS